MAFLEELELKTLRGYTTETTPVPDNETLASWGLATPHSPEAWLQRKQEQVAPVTVRIPHRYVWYIARILESQITNYHNQSAYIKAAVWEKLVRDVARIKDGNFTTAVRQAHHIFDEYAEIVGTTEALTAVSRGRASVHKLLEAGLDEAARARAEKVARLIKELDGQAFREAIKIVLNGTDPWNELDPSDPEAAADEDPTSRLIWKSLKVQQSSAGLVENVQRVVADE